MLRFAEEILLLLLDDENGRFAPVDEGALQFALAGAVLMDLALENRIDTDLQKLVLVDTKATGDAMLDSALVEIAASERRRDARYWVEQLVSRAEDIRSRALERLIAKGILERREDRFLWVFRARRYPVIDGAAEREVKLRIRDVLFKDEIPGPRDVVIICLAHVCGLLGEILTRQELHEAHPRIEQVRKMDLIGRAVTAIVADSRQETAERLQYLISQAAPAQ